MDGLNVNFISLIIVDRISDICIGLLVLAISSLILSLALSWSLLNLGCYHLWSNASSGLVIFWLYICKTLWYLTFNCFETCLAISWLSSIKWCILSIVCCYYYLIYDHHSSALWLILTWWNLILPWSSLWSSIAIFLRWSCMILYE